MYLLKHRNTGESLAIFSVQTMPQRLSYREPAYAVRDCVLRYDPAWNTSLLFIGRAYK